MDKKLLLRLIGKVLRHKAFVFVYGLDIGVPFGRLLRHDLSKLYREEILGSIELFVLGRSPAKSEAIRKAARHHFSVNPHHWQFWMKDGEAIPMPEEFVREMVVDWRATSCERTGDGRIETVRAWFEKARLAMKLHPLTEERVRRILQK